MTKKELDWREVKEHPRVRYRRVDWANDLELVRRLFSEYRQWVAEHAESGKAAEKRVRAGLTVLDELSATLPGAYGPPRGDVLLWFESDELVACGALREQEPSIGELIRVYIRPDYRGEGFGKPFVRTLIARSRELGYRRLRAYALGSMTSALEFYEELGFRRIPPYWPHPASEVVFFERQVRE